MKLEWYKKFTGYQSVKITGDTKDFLDKFLLKDVNGKILYDGDEIQGYNNRKYAADRANLYETEIMIVKYPDIYKLYYSDTFEPYPEKWGQPWLWKL